MRFHNTDRVQYFDSIQYISSRNYLFEIRFNGVFNCNYSRYIIQDIVEIVKKFTGNDKMWGHPYRKSNITEPLIFGEHMTF